MGLLSRLLGSAPDPTASWPPLGVKPALALTGQVGPLRLGDPLDQARPLGRPRRYTARGSGADLDYDGYHLEFQDGRLICANFDMEEAKRVTVGDFELSATTTPLDVQVWLGEPSSDSTGGDGLRWIDYERDGKTLALEFQQERLVCVQLYNEEFA